MNALTTATPGTPSASALLPTNMNDAMRLAELMAKARLLPQAVQNPADAFLVINQAMRWGMDPFAVAQEVSVISGKLMHSGKIVAAAINSSGVLEGRLRYDYSGEGQGRTITVSGTLRGEGEPRSVDVKLADAKTNNQMWTKQPDQQLAYFGARVWARRYAPEVMLGVYSPEEMPDAPEQAPLPPARGPVVESTAERAPTAPDVPLIVVAPDGTERDAPKIEQWVRWSLAAIGKLESGAALSAWQAAMEPHLEAVQRSYPEQAAQVRQAASDQLDALATAYEPGAVEEGV